MILKKITTIMNLEDFVENIHRIPALHSEFSIYLKITENSLPHSKNKLEKISCIKKKDTNDETHSKHLQSVEYIVK